MQFGVGPELAAQCPQSPTPDGWRAWLESDGPIPDALAKRAAAVGADLSVPLGATESYPLPGVTVLMRVEPHTWGRDDKGNLTQGCFRAVGIYIPAIEEVRPPTEGRNKLDTTVGVLTAASLVIGIGASIWHWKKAA